MDTNRVRRAIRRNVGIVVRCDGNGYAFGVPVDCELYTAHGSVFELHDLRDRAPTSGSERNDHRRGAPLADSSEMINSVKFLKLSFLTIAIVFFLIVGLSDRRAGAFSSGPPAGFTDAPGESNCTACHTSFPLNS